MIVVDTHAWLWWVSEPRRLGKAARRSLEAAKRIGVPAICCLEIATLVSRGRISLDRPALEWMQDALGGRRIDLLPLTPAVAVKAADLPSNFPGDPADRIITATAILESAVLVTRDDRIRESPLVRTLWA